jgi:predicted nucleotidyltransferase
MTPINIEPIARKVLLTYPVKRAALFGSAARGDMKDNSDIDMIVEFLPGRGGVDFEFFGLLVDLEEAFGRSVDLLTFDALETETKPRFRENVMRDVRVFYEREN